MYRYTNNNNKKTNQAILFKHFNKQIKAWVLAQPAASKQPETSATSSINCI